MITKSATVIFFGSGPLAASGLSLLAKDFDIEAVITKSTPLHHKGAVPVLELANELGLKTYTTENKDQLDKIFVDNQFQSALAVLIDFGIIVSQKTIDYFDKGIVNSHFSVLPEWRGADPISYALLSGQKTTGVSLMLLVRDMDEGPLIAFEETDIDERSSITMLSDKLVKLSHQLLVKYLPLYLDNKLKPYSQFKTGKTVSYSHKLTKEDGVIDWKETAEVIERKIRTYLVWPKSHTTINGIDLVITEANVSRESNTSPGKFSLSGHKLVIDCGIDQLEITRLIPTGKPEMTAQSFLAGYLSKLI